MMNSLIRSNDNDRFSPRGPMDDEDENMHPNDEKNWPDHESSQYYKLKILQQQLLQQQPVVSLSSSSSSSLHNNAVYSCSSTTSSSSTSTVSSPLMVLAAAAAATETMNNNHSTKSSLLDFSLSENNTNSSNDPPSNCMTERTASSTPFCTTDFDRAAVPMTTLSPNFLYPHYETTLSPTNNVSATGLACLVAVSSHARDAFAASTATPYRRRMESMLMDEQKCLMAMSSIPSYSHPLFAITTTTTPSSSSSNNNNAGMDITSSSTPMIPFHDDTEQDEPLRFNVRRWNENEDKCLKKAIELEGHAWTLIATKYFGNTRNKSQCKSHWEKQLDPSLNRSAWTNEEDETILRLQEQGKAWSEIAHVLPGRSAEQINYRFTNHIDPALPNKKLPFTEKERATLMNTVAQCGEPKNWKEIAKVYFPGKSALQVKNCWHNAKKPKKTRHNATPQVPANTVDHAIPAPFLVPESAKTSSVTRSSSRATVGVQTSPVQTTAVSSSPFFQLPVCNIEKQSHSTTPSVARVEQVVSAISLNATSAKKTSNTSGRSRTRSRDNAKKPPMAVSSPPPSRTHSFVRWSKREDKILKQAIEMEGPVWDVIAPKYFANTRNEEACRNRWIKHLDPVLKKGSWTQEEDAIILRGKEQGMKFSEIAGELPGRTGDVVRSRYMNHLDPALLKAKFTDEEKTIIMQVAAQHGEPKNWAFIAQHVPGRSVLQVKNYWHNTSKRKGGVVFKNAAKKKTKRQHEGGVSSASSFAAKTKKKAKTQHREQVDQDHDLTNHY